MHARQKKTKKKTVTHQTRFYYVGFRDPRELLLDAPRPLVYHRTLADGGAVSPDGDKRREASGGGILGWLARQFTNQAKCVPLLRWPQYGFFNPKTWFNTVADSVVILLCLVAFVFVLAAADKLAIMIYRVLVPGAS